MAIGPKLGSPRGSHVLHRLMQGKDIKKIILSETTSHRALVFCMKHHLVDAYQVCSNYAPGTQKRPVLGSHVLHRLIFGKNVLKVLVKVLSDPSSKLFGGLDDAFP